MTIRLTKPVIAAATAVGIFLLIPGSQAQVATSSAEIKITVVDQIGAVIADGDVVFTSDSKTIISHTGKDGSVTVTLPSGQYAVTASHYGFLKTNVPDFQVVAPQPNDLKIVLKVGGPAMICTLPCGPMVNLEVPTITSDVSAAIPPDPEPPTEPETRKARSWHCLYLWKCASP
jgi:hypothetical protein